MIPELRLIVLSRSIDSDIQRLFDRKEDYTANCRIERKTFEKALGIKRNHRILDQANSAGCRRYLYSQDPLFQLTILKNYPLKREDEIIVCPTFELRFKADKLESLISVLKIVNEQFLWKFTEPSREFQKSFLEAYSYDANRDLLSFGQEVIIPFFRSGTIIEARKWTDYKSLSEKVNLS